MTKLCKKCEQTKSLDCFHRQLRNRDGRQSICKSCRKVLDKQIYTKCDKKRRSNTEARNKLRDELRSYKAAHGCLCCGEKEPICLDFHHPNDDKLMTIMIDYVSRSRDAVWEEVAKCVVLCANCHRKVHAELIVLPTGVKVARLALNQ